jgi:hypothetical protein
LRTGAEMVQKWAVLPVSAMAGAEEGGERDKCVEQGGPIDVGASRGQEAEKAELRTGKEDINTFLAAGTAGASRGFPLGHTPGVGVPRRGPR